MRGLRLGITGHRHLDDPGAAAAAMERLMDRLGDLLAAREPPSPTWVGVSPLAKGADQIFAEAVLKRPAARLEVITPFPLDDYRKDFVEAADREAFESLLTRADCLEQLPFDRSNGSGKCAGYSAVGRRVVDLCEILIAYWDGRPAAGIGGTGEIVEYALALGRQVIWIDARDPGAESGILMAGGIRGDLAAIAHRH